MKRRKAIKLAIDIIAKERDKFIAQSVNGGILNDTMFGEYYKDRRDELEKLLKVLQKMRTAR